MGPSNWGLFRGAEKLPCCSGYSRSPGRSSDGWVFRGTVKLLSCMKLFSGVGGYGLWFLFPHVQQNSRKAFTLLCQLTCMPQSPWEVFRLWCLLPSCPVYRGAPGMPSSCGVFRGADKLAISCSVALCSGASPEMPSCCGIM